jgi:chloride channel protein, CIC family
MPWLKYGLRGRDVLINLSTRLRTSENTVFLLFSALLGLVVGFAIFAFRQGIDFFHHIFAEWTAHTLLGPVLGAAGIVVSLSVAGFLVGVIMDRFVGEERHHGVAGVMENVALAGGRLRYKRMPFKAVASALSLGAGASIGPEDPSVQIGSNIGSWLGQRLHLSEDYVRLLVAAGAASAIAAAFKAPIAGVFFALEVILNNTFETKSFGVIVLAAVVSSAITQAIEPGAEMGPFAYHLGTMLEIPLFIPLGLGLAFVAVVFTRAVYWQHDLWHKYVHVSRPVRTALAGALVGIVGIALPQIMGTGRETINGVLSGEVNFTFTLLLALAGFKILMTTLSMAGGFVGGIFAPALFVGVMLGNAYGQIIEVLVPGVGGDPQSYAIAGMAATMAGIVRSPITAIMLVFELTNDYRLILPIMLTSVICVYIAERLEPSGIYSLGLLRKGVHLPQGREVDLMQSVTVNEVMQKPAPAIPETASLSELRDAMRDQKSHSLCVLDSEGLLSGIVTFHDLERASANPQNKAQTVGEICTRRVITVQPEDILWTVIRAMSTHDVGRIPVIKRGTREVVGLVRRHGIMRAYNIAVTRRLQDQHTAERIRLNALTGAHVFEFYVQPDAVIVGQCISAVSWPHESTIASIQRNGRLIIPHGSTAIEAGDLLAIVADPSTAKELAALTKSSKKTEWIAHST